MRKDNIIQRLGLLLVIAGIMLPGTAGAVIPTVCGGRVTDLTNQENVYVDGTYSADPVICYSFTVGDDPKQLAVNLKYVHTADKNLDMYLFEPSGTILNSNKAPNQGDEFIFVDPASAQTTYYVRVNGGAAMNGHAYQFKWFDQDNTANFPTVTMGSENPADKADVQAGESSQLLRVAVSDAVSCTFHYGTNTSTTASIDGSISGDYCETTVTYGTNMTDDGINYWYVEAVNTAGITRYPAIDTLSFTVHPPLEISSPSPADGASVTAGSSGQLLQVEVSNVTDCTFYYGVDTSATASVEGAINGAYCEATVSYGADMIDNGTNYWYVDAENAVTAIPIRYPVAPNVLSFTVSTTPGNKSIIAPILMLLLNNKENEEPPSPILNPVIAPILMLLL